MRLVAVMKFGRLSLRVARLLLWVARLLLVAGLGLLIGRLRGGRGRNARLGHGRRSAGAGGSTDLSAAAAAGFSVPVATFLVCRAMRNVKNANVKVASANKNVATATGSLTSGQ